MPKKINLAHELQSYELFKYVREILAISTKALPSLAPK